MKNRLLIGVSAFALVASVSITPQFATRPAHAQAAPSSGALLLAQTDEELLQQQKKKKKNKDAQGEEASEQAPAEQPAQSEEQPRKKKKSEQAQEQPAQEQPAQAEEQQPRKKKNREQAQEEPAAEQPVQAEEQQPRKKKQVETQAQEPAADDTGQQKKRKQQAEEQPAEQPPAATATEQAPATTTEQAPATTTTGTEAPAQVEGDDQQRKKKRNQAAGEQPAGETVTQQPTTEKPAGETVTQQPTTDQPAGDTVTQQPTTEQPAATTTTSEEGAGDKERKKRRGKSVDAEVITPEEQQKVIEEAKQPATVSPEAAKPKDIVTDQPVEEIVKKAEKQPQAVVSDQITENQREELRKAERRRRENVRENRNELLGAAAVGIAIGAAIPLLGGTVAADEGDRIVVERGGQYYVRKDESALFRYDADDIEYERLRGGRVREIVTRPNGSQIITIRDAGGYVLRREKITRDGRRIVLYDMREEDYGRPYQPVEIAYYEIDIPRDEYIVSARRADRELFYDTFEAPPVYQTNERYTLRDIRENEQVRSLVRRVDLDTITFETGSAFVTESQVALLGDIAGGMLDVIEKDPSAVFLIEGHTDAVGSEISNMTLSDRRAEAVARILSEAYDVPPENMVVQGYGESYLKIQTEGPERANRRVTLRNITPILQTSSGENPE